MLVEVRQFSDVVGHDFVPSICAYGLDQGNEPPLERGKTCPGGSIRIFTRSEDKSRNLFRKIIIVPELPSPLPVEVML
jgi:hypothetical protein